MNKIQVGLQPITNNYFRQGKFYVHKDGEICLAAKTEDLLLLICIESGNRWDDEDYSRVNLERVGFTEVAVGTTLTITVGE